MVKGLASKLSSLINRAIRSVTLSKEEIEKILKELKLSLIEADVDVEIVNGLINKIKKRVLEEKTPAGLTLREHFIKTIYEELVEILGKESYEIKPGKIMLLGLFGSGKTSTAGKLGYYFKKKGYKVLLVGLDYHRPAAPEQLKQLAQKASIACITANNLQEALAKAKSIESKYDVIIYDTAGRDALDKELAEELKEINKAIKAEEKILVLPADIGKIARKQAEEFNKLVGITGIIITKLDSTAKAGAAIAACVASNAKVKMVGTGEHLSDLEVYKPEAFVSRLLGFGDLQALMEKVKEVGLDKKAEKIIKTEFTLEDFLEQLEALQSMGPLSKLSGMLPSIGPIKISEEALAQQEKKLKAYKAIIQSMTKEERNNPSIINASRIKRIAKGSGRSEQEVRELLRNYEMMKSMMGKIKGRELRKFLQKFKLL